MNPIDDALMEIATCCAVVLLDASRQIVLYRALDASALPSLCRAGHLPYVMGEGNKKLSSATPSRTFCCTRPPA